MILAILSIAAPVGIHVDGKELEVSRRQEIAAAIGRAVTMRTGRSVVLDQDLWSQGCRDADRCVAEVRSRTRVEDVLIVDVLTGVTKLRLVARRFAPERGPLEASIDLPAGNDEAAIAELTAQLFLPAPEVEVEPVPPIDSSPRTWTWVAAGTTVAILGTAVALGVSSRSARSALAEPMTGAESEPLAGRARGHGLAANILFAVAAISAGVTVTLYFTE